VNYFEKVQRSPSLSSFSKWPLLAAGPWFWIVAAIVEMRSHNLNRATAWFAVDCGMILYGFTEIMLQRKSVRFGGAYWAICTYR
jgi:hypothetical protein